MATALDFRLSEGSGRIAVPVRLCMRAGERVGGLLPGLDAASALVISESADGVVSQGFHPLKLRLDPAGSDPGDVEWALHAVRAGAEAWVYFLGVPAAALRPGGSGSALQSLSIQIVGHSALRSEASFAGHVSVGFAPESDALLLPRFERFADQWFPVLLPESFVASQTWSGLEEEGGSNILVVTLARGAHGDLPPSLRVEWDPVGWNEAVVESAHPGSPGHFLIRGGCFVSPEGRVSHWFGGNIGLRRPGFRNRASKQVLEKVPSGEASWCFWLEPAGASRKDPAGFTAPPESKDPIRVRHAALGLAWNGPSAASAIARPEYRQAMDMLRHAARIRAGYHSAWERLRTRQGLGETELVALESVLGEDVRAFYGQHATLLGRLAVFQAGRPAAANPLAAIAEFAAAAYRTQEAP